MITGVEHSPSAWMMKPPMTSLVGLWCLHMMEVVQQMLRRAIQAYSSEDADAAHGVLVEDERIDALYGQIVRSIVAEVPQSPEAMAGHLDLLSVAKNLERIADHATNIAEDVVFLSTGQIVRHQAGGPQT